MSHGHWKTEENNRWMNEWMNESVCLKENGNLCTWTLVILLTGQVQWRRRGKRKKIEPAWGKSSAESVHYYWVRRLYYEQCGHCHSMTQWTEWGTFRSRLMSDLTWLTKLAFALSVWGREEWAKSVFVGYFLLESTVEMTSISRPKLYNLLLFNVLLVLSPCSMSYTQRACQWLFHCPCSIFLRKRLSSILWYLTCKEEERKVRKTDEVIVGRVYKGKKNKTATMTQMTSQWM